MSNCKMCSLPRHKLDNFWLRREPLESTVSVGGSVFHMVADSDELAFSLESGQIEFWSRNAYYDGHQQKTGVVETGVPHGLRIGLLENEVVGGFFESNVRMWDRKTGELLQVGSSHCNTQLAPCLTTDCSVPHCMDHKAVDAF